ncbi:hypothetical protein QE327_gp034 [Pseudomonas phage Henu5]|uniref:Uncharacterized protein n=1 Tax=Pseudomonas phage Henu5 TaxID=2499902 RepID=A0A410T7U3_9CAUD|nr:hypothetical protein QE327_gp034 [Pseudomonas phage Henu5]QAU05067.1 hypothetical protein Henu5_gp36 [Pseudomonas phage Henu5]
MLPPLRLFVLLEGHSTRMAQGVKLLIEFIFDSVHFRTDKGFEIDRTESGFTLFHVQHLSGGIQVRLAGAGRFASGILSVSIRRFNLTLARHLSNGAVCLDEFHTEKATVFRLVEDGTLAIYTNRLSHYFASFLFSLTAQRFSA